MHALAAFFNLSVLLVILAAVLDILANLLLARSQGFHRRRIGFTALALVGLAFYCLSLAVKNMDLAASLGGWLFFNQRLKPCAFAGMGLLIAGMLLLHLG